MPDDEGYPTDAELDELKAMDPINGFDAIMQRVAELWWSPGDLKAVREVEPGVWSVATLGWSGNESVISALRESHFWMFYWCQSRRGGHFVFASRQALSDDETINRVCCWCDLCPRADEGK